jgi:hypothetical protein
LSHRRQRLRPDHRAAEFGQPIEQQPFGRRLRNHQRVRVLGRQHREIDRDQQAPPVADGEARCLHPLLDQSARHVEVGEDLERAGIDHGGARRVGARGLRVHHGCRHTLPDQRRGQRESAGARSDDEDIGVVHFVSFG